MLGGTAENLGAQRIFLGAPGYRAAVRQQLWSLRKNKQEITCGLMTLVYSVELESPFLTNIFFFAPLADA